MSIDEVAQHLGVSGSWLYKLAREGKIPARKEGWQWQFDEEEISQWWSRRATNPLLEGQKSTIRHTVKTVRPHEHLKKVILEDEKTTLLVPRSTCVAQGDYIDLTEEAAWVCCENGRVQIFPIYAAREHLQVGGLELKVLIKEITESEELHAYQALAQYHYRSHAPYGRKATLVVRNFHPIYPKVIGYVELTSSFYMNKARTTVLDAPFQANGISWLQWDKATGRKYIHLIVRIARCVVYPEFRGLGLGQLLIKHAAEFARHRWQVAKLKPYFLEISADMLKFVPFVEKAGMKYVGETEGNLSRVAKDMAYLLKNQKRVQAGEIVREDSFGIVDKQVSRMRKAAFLMEQQGWSLEELVSRLEQLTRSSVLKNFNLFHEIVSLPKPTYLMGLTREAEDFLEQRIAEIAPQNGYTSPLIQMAPLTGPIVFEGISLAHESRVRRTKKTHAIQQAFGISPEEVCHKIINNLSLTLKPGEVVIVTGPSGSGKTTFLQLLRGKKYDGLTGNVCWPDNYHPGVFEPISSQKALIEGFGRQDIREALHLMGFVGLSDAFVYLKRFDELSNGQQYRVMLARLIAGGYNVWIVDEFCANLDVVTANIVASRLQKLARKLGVVLVVASSQPEIFAKALCPDQIIQLTTAWEHHIMSGSAFLNALSPNHSTFEPPTLRISKEYLPAIRSGRKRSTIRKGRRPIKIGLLLLSAGADFVPVNVTDVTVTRFGCLGDEEARKDGFANLRELERALQKHNPDLSPNSFVTIVSFDISCRVETEGFDDRSGA